MTAGIQRVAIVGAGVGGLTLAAALRRRGFEATIFEQAPRLRREGTGLGLWTNATVALRNLGLCDVLDGIAEPLERLVALSGRGGRLAEVRLDQTAKRYSAPSVNVQRAELLEALARAAGDEEIKFGARCASFEQDTGGVTVRFADGTERSSDLLVAADGAGSTIRRVIHGEGMPGETRRWSGWQGVALQSPDGLPERTGLFVLSGQSLVGLYPLTEGRVHWFMDDPAPPAPSTADPNAEERFSGHVATMPAVVRESVAATPRDSVVYNEVRDLEPGVGRWGEGRVTLLGDAAHPMLPTLGQGACQAIEDTAVLVRCLERRLSDPEDALRSYERARSARAAAFVRASRRSADLRRRAPAGLRDPLLRATPSRFVSLLFNRTIRPA